MENKKVLQAKLGDLLNCYDPRIRNAESHLSTRWIEHTIR